MWSSNAHAAQAGGFAGCWGFGVLPHPLLLNSSHRPAVSCALGAGEVALELYQQRDPSLMAEATRRPVGSLAATAGEHPSSPTPVSLAVGFLKATGIDPRLVIPGGRLV